MSPDVDGRLQRRRCTRAASRPLSMLAAGVLTIATLGLVGPSIAGALGLSVDHAATSQRSGFEQAQRLDAPAPRTTTPPPSTPSPSPTPGTTAAVQGVLDLTNAERAARGLAPLQLHPDLMRAADMHFTDQYRQGCNNLSHTGTDGSSPFDRIKRTPLRYRTAGENIACGYPTPAAVVDGWMNSDGHRRNILNGSFTHIGIVGEPDAFGRMYWVQVFATPR